MPSKSEMTSRLSSTSSVKQILPIFTRLGSMRYGIYCPAPRKKSSLPISFPAHSSAALSAQSCGYRSRACISNGFITARTCSLLCRTKPSVASKNSVSQSRSRSSITLLIRRAMKQLRPTRLQPAEHWVSLKMHGLSLAPAKCSHGSASMTLSPQQRSCRI